MIFGGGNIARISTHPLDASLELPSLLRKEGGGIFIDVLESL